MRRGGRPLDELIATLEAADDASPMIARAMGIEAGRLVRNCFDTSTAPDGARWAALKRPRRGKGPLVVDGKLRDEASHAILAPSGFELRAEFPKGVHQEGFATLLRWLPARPFFPSGALPLSWERALDRAAVDALKRRLP